MEKAYNPSTGEVLFLVGDQWTKPSQTAENPKTGERAYLVENQWEIFKPPAAQQQTAPAPQQIAPAAKQPTPQQAQDFVSGDPMGGDIGSAIVGEANAPRNKTYTGSVFDTQPFNPPFDAAEAKRLSRRDYATKEPSFGRRPPPSIGSIPKEQEEPRSAARAAADAYIGAMQGGVGFLKGITDNVPGEGPTNAIYQAFERIKTPQLKSSIAARQGLISAVQENQGELAAARAAFNTMFSPAGADVVAKGAGSFIPSMGMSLIGLGTKAITAANMLSNAGDAANSAAENLRRMSPENWSKNQVYQDLRASGLSHRDAVTMLAPIYALPAQAMGAATGYVSGSTGFEKTLTGGAAKGLRGRLGRAGIELAGEELETLAPLVTGNLTQRAIDERTDPFKDVGQSAVETALGSLPGSALAMTGREAPPPRQPSAPPLSPSIMQGLVGGAPNPLAGRAPLLGQETVPTPPTDELGRIEPQFTQEIARPPEQITQTPTGKTQEERIKEETDKLLAKGYTTSNATRIAKTRIEEQDAAEPSSGPTITDATNAVPDISKWTEKALADTLSYQLAKPVTLPQLITNDMTPQERSVRNQPLIDAIKIELGKRQEGAPDVRQPDIEPSGTSTSVAGQPNAKLPAERVGAVNAERVVSTGQTTAGPAPREAVQPTTLEEITAPSVKTTAEVTETEQPATNENEAANQAVAAETKKRGKPPLPVEVAQIRKAARDTYRKQYNNAKNSFNVNNNSAVKELESAIAPVNEDELVDDDAVKEAQEYKRTQKVSAIQKLLDIESKFRGSSLGKQAKAVLNDRTKISQKEIDDVKRGIEYRKKLKPEDVMGGVGTDISGGYTTAPKSSASRKNTVRKVNPKLTGVINGAQALTAIKGTGSWFQNLLADRLRPFVPKLKVMVLEKGQPLPAALTRANEDPEGKKPWNGLFIGGDNPVIYLTGASYGVSNGQNNITLLHEMLHAVLNNRLAAGFAGIDAKAAQFARQITLLARLAGATYKINLARGLVTPELRARVKSTEIKDEDGNPVLDANGEPTYEIFDSPAEFLAYAMTEGSVQDFLRMIPSIQTAKSVLSDFVSSAARLLGLGKGKNGEIELSALTDIITATDDLLSVPLSDAQLEAANAGLAGKPSRSAPDEIVRARPGTNAQRLGKMLGSKLYGTPTDIAKVSVKELFQNSFDAVKEGVEKGQITKGKISIEVDQSKRTIQVVDNGPGMPTSVMGNQFLQIAGTVKGTKRASGGLGVAKMLFLFENKKLEVISLHGGVISRLNTTGEELKLAMASNPRTLFETLKDFLSKDDMVAMEPIIEAAIQRQKESGVEVPDIVVSTSTNPDAIKELTKTLFPYGHGTSISIEVPESYEDTTTGETKDIPFNEYDIENAYVLRQSPLFTDIDVTLQRGNRVPEQLKLGSTFPIDNYTPFANVRFNWGTARIYVTKNKTAYASSSNAHVLSNGLWQFNTTIKDRPGFDGKPIQRDFYVDVSPNENVEPSDAAYPFDLNRQNFSKTGIEDFQKIFNYITVIYSQVDLASETKNFGTVQYVNADGSLTTPEVLEPKAPASDNAFTLIKPGDSVDVKDGVLYVNNRPIPELTNDDLKNVNIRIDELTIPQDEIDPNKVMVHDNTMFGMDRTSYLTERGWDVTATGNVWTATKEGKTYTEPKDISDLVKQMVADGAIEAESLSDRAREKFGQRYDSYLAGIGNVFQLLRDTLVTQGHLGRGAYAEEDRKSGYLNAQAIGVSLDIEYYGVSTLIPFKGMFINPAATKLYGTPAEIAVSLIGTMVHELSHYKIRGHNDYFASEMQNVMGLLRTAPGFDFNKIESDLIKFIAGNKDIFDFLNGEFRNGTLKARGNRFADSSYEQIEDEGASKPVAGISQTGQKQQGVSSGTTPSTPSTGQVSVPAGNAGKAKTVGKKSRNIITLPKAWERAKIAFGKSAASTKFKNRGLRQRIIDRLKTPDELAEWVKSAWPMATAAQREVMARLPSTGFLGSWTNDLGLPHINRAYELMTEMTGAQQALANNTEQLIYTLAKAFKKNPGLADKTAELVYMTTTAEVDPSDPNAKERVVEADAMYKALGKEGRAAYNLAKNHYEDRGDLYIQLLKDNLDYMGLDPAVKKNILTLIRSTYESGQRIRPYFALVRDEGTYWLSVGKNATDVNREFYIYDSMAARNQDRARMLKQRSNIHTEVGNNLDDFRPQAYQSSALIKGVFDAIDASSTTDANFKENLKDAVYQAYLNVMPEKSFRGMFKHRGGYAGYRTDLLQNIAATDGKMNAQIAKLEFAQRLRNEVDAAQAAIKGREDLQPFVSELKRRVSNVLSPKPYDGWDAAAGIFGRLGFTFLLAGPSLPLIQPAALFMSGVPILWGNYKTNPAEAGAAIINAFANIPKYGITQTLPDGSTRYRWPSLTNSKTLTGDELRAVKEFGTSGVANSTMTRTIWDFAGSPSSNFVKEPGKEIEYYAKQTMRGIDTIAGSPFHIMEKWTREALFLAAYRLGRNKNNNLSHEEAFAKAISNVREILGDYETHAKPRWMQRGIPKAMFALKTFSVLMYEQTVGNLVKAIPFLNKEGKKAAIKKFSGVFITAGLLAGAQGLPFASILYGMAASIVLALGAGGDDNEDDAELREMNPGLWLRSVWMPKNMPNVKIMGEPLYDWVDRGIPTMLTGWDLASKLGVSNLWGSETPKTAKTTFEATTNLLKEYFGGAYLSMAEQWMRAQDAFDLGDTQKGTELMTPKAIRDYLKSERFKEEGVTGSKGQEILEPGLLTALELWGQKLGFTPDIVSVLQKEGLKAAAAAAKVGIEREKLLNKLDIADKTDTPKGDDEFERLMEEEVEKFNDKYPSSEITWKNVRESLKAREKARNNAIAGVMVTKKQKEALGPLLDKMEERVEKRREKMHIELTNMAPKRP